MSHHSSAKEDDVPPWARRYPPAAIRPAEFEAWIGDLLRAAEPAVDDLRVAVHDRVNGTDGSYDLDATVRYRWAGLDFLVLVEAKLHRNPIKRDLVQILHAKVQSVGASKGVMFATAHYQRGALEFAMAHGIALVSVTEGRFTFETRAVDSQPSLSREEALELGVPVFVGHWYGAGDSPGSIAVSTISPEDPDEMAAVFGVPAEASR